MGRNSTTKLAKGERIDHEKPPFTITQIKKAIPPHCFQRSLYRSFSYVIVDVILVSIFYHIAATYFHHLVHPLHHLIVWPLYWFCQGSVFTALWVIAHECGHLAFADNKLVNDVVGFLIHSSLLVPFFSFKISHRRHHFNTSSVDRDEIFLPKAKADIPWYYNYLTNPPARAVIIFLTLTLGWPFYLAFNCSGRSYDTFTSHYYPNSPIFTKKEWLKVHISNAGVVAMLYFLYRFAVAKGIGYVVRMYLMPFIIMNGLVALISSLQHTHPSLPCYDSTEWEWLRGNLGTVDRDYGVLNTVLHHITDTHVIHHLFPSMPHYNAVEATRAAKGVLGEYYHFDRTPIFKAVWREYRECVYVEPDKGASKGVFWFRNKV